MILEMGSHLDPSLASLAQSSLELAEESFGPRDSGGYESEFPQGFLVAFTRDASSFAEAREELCELELTVARKFQGLPQGVNHPAK